MDMHACLPLLKILVIVALELMIVNDFHIFLDPFFYFGYNKNEDRTKEVNGMQLAQKTVSILTQITVEAKRVFGSSLYSVLLYGSYARGDYDDESDMDIMILVDIPREQLSSYKKPFLTLTSDLGLINDILITVTLKDLYTFEKYLDAVPFYQNVKKEGVAIAV